MEQTTISGALPSNDSLSKLSQELREQVQAELRNGEEVLWAGMPDAWGAWTQTAGGAGIGGLLFGTVAVLILSGFVSESWAAGAFAMFLCGPVIAIAGALLCSPWYVARGTRHTAYLVTRRRAIIFRAGRCREVVSYAPRSLLNLRETVRKNGLWDVKCLRPDGEPFDADWEAGRQDFSSVPEGDELIQAISELRGAATLSQLNDNQRSTSLVVATVSNERVVWPTRELHLIEPELQEGEQVLWIGRPSSSRRNRYVFFGTLIGCAIGLNTLIWSLVAVSVEPGRPPDGTGAIGFFCGLIALGMITTPWYWRRSAIRTRYALTNRRALIVSQGWRKRIRSYRPAELSVLKCRLMPDGTGDLIFERAAAQPSDALSLQAGANGFFRIEGVREVRDLVVATVDAAPPEPVRPRPRWKRW